MNYNKLWQQAEKECIVPDEFFIIPGKAEDVRKRFAELVIQEFKKEQK